MTTIKQLGRIAKRKCPVFYQIVQVFLKKRALTVQSKQGYAQRRNRYIYIYKYLILLDCHFSYFSLFLYKRGICLDSTIFRDSN